MPTLVIRKKKLAVVTYASLYLSMLIPQYAINETWEKRVGTGASFSPSTSNML